MRIKRVMLLLFAVCVVTIVAAASAGAAASSVGEYKGVKWDEKINQTNPDAEKLTYRTVARVELIQKENINKDVSVKRTNFSTRQQQRPSQMFRQWNNAVWLALQVSPTGEDSTQQINQVRRSNTNAFYSYSDDTVYLPNSSTPGEKVIAHEVTHFIQDIKYKPSRILSEAKTQDEALAAQSLVEGHAEIVESQYRERCSSEWSCYTSSTGISVRTNRVRHGILSTLTFPYQEGVLYHKNSNRTLRSRFEDPPDSTREILYGKEYGKVAPVDSNKLSIRWQKISDSFGRNGQESVGPAGVSLLLWQIENRASGQQLSRPDYSEIRRHDSELVEHLKADGITPVIDIQSRSIGYIFVTKWESERHAKEFAQAYTQEMFKESFTGYDTYLIQSGGYSGVYTVQSQENTVKISYTSSVSGTPPLLKGKPGLQPQPTSIYEFIKSDMSITIAILIIIVSLLKVVRKDD